MHKICYIIGAGAPSSVPPQPRPGDLLIAADGGYAYAQKHGLTPDFVIGDFDSLDCVPNHPGLIRLNPMKDETDTLSAIQFGQARGYRHFVIYGGTGGRTAHTVANLQNLVMLAQSGQRGWLVGQGEVFTAVSNGSIRFSAQSKGYLSVFSMTTESTGVSETGLKYLLDNFTMTNAYPVGVSNEFIGETAEISVETGTLLIIYTTEAAEI
ncbi:MAG: thiamine diphosphokinase [Clostridiaceae bacterium]|nr:thiamine diphosphokinase [Clostridiaceae bacterium]